MNEARINIDPPELISVGAGRGPLKIRVRVWSEKFPVIHELFKAYLSGNGLVGLHESESKFGQNLVRGRIFRKGFAVEFFQSRISEKIIHGTTEELCTDAVPSQL
jgi:hypothetical protein